MSTTSPLLPDPEGEGWEQGCYCHVPPLPSLAGPYWWEQDE